MKLKTVILDFDGTIADTSRSILQTVKETLNVLKLPQPDEYEVRQLIGLPLRDTFTKCAGIKDEHLMTEAIDIYRSLYTVISEHTVTLFPQVKETVCKLHENGVIVAVASSKGKLALTTLLDKLGISPYITSVFGEQDVKNKKPAPDMVLHILAMSQTDPCDALVAGDTVFDIAMGQAAGCHTCGVTYGNYSRQQLMQQGAEWVVDSFADVLDIVECPTQTQRV